MIDDEDLKRLDGITLTSKTNLTMQSPSWNTDLKESVDRVLLHMAKKHPGGHFTAKDAVQWIDKARAFMEVNPIALARYIKANQDYLGIDVLGKRYGVYMYRFRKGNHAL